MKDRKAVFNYFSIMDYEKEQEYLWRMHAEGWRFTGITFPVIYHFERCVPEKVIYQLDYNQEGIAHKEEYVQMFRDCGWEYLMDYVGYSYFRRPADRMSGDEGIFCDDSSRLDMMQRVFKGRMIPLFIIFFAVIIPQLVILYSQRGPVGFMFISYTVLFLIYMLIFISFGIKYYQFKNRLHR